MSWFKLKSPVGSNYRINPNDLTNTKQALNQLGYYNVPPHRGIDDWTDDAMFDGIRRFQGDNSLKIDGFMRPGGPTENAINQRLQRASFGSSLFADDSSDGPFGYSTYQCTPCAQPPNCGQNPCVKPCLPK